MRYKLFGKHTGLRVSELVLGAGTFGTRWGHGAEPDEAGRIFNAYADAGGNFIDTANGYQFGQSEEILGGSPVRTARRFRAGHEIHLSDGPEGRRPRHRQQPQVHDLVG